MTADNFVESLKKIAPNAATLVKKGLSMDFAIRLNRGYFAPLRDEPKSEEDFEILNLIFNYHADNLEVGNLAFPDAPVTFDGLGENYYGVGFYHWDHLILDRNTGKILIYYDDLDQFETCADSSEQFFDALMHRLSANNWGDANSEEMTIQNRRECSVMAGNIDYCDIWYSI